MLRKALSVKSITYTTPRSAGFEWREKDRETQQEKARNSQGFYISIGQRPALSSYSNFRSINAEHHGGRSEREVGIK